MLSMDAARRSNGAIEGFGRVCLWAALLLCGQPGFAQVSPAEILNPDLKAAEAKYLPQLKELNQQITATKFPFPFTLSRYVGLDPAQRAEADSRGIEFVRFHDRVVLKITGNYNAAYNGDLLTQNERASRTFQNVVVPVLKFVNRSIPANVTCDAIGFELSYHVRTPNRNYDYEGKEILVVVFAKPDAFGFLQAASDAARQAILNRSEIYLNGTEFGLDLSGPDPLNVEALARSVPHKSSESSSAKASNAVDQLATAHPELLPGYAGPHVPPGTPPGPDTPGERIASGSNDSAEKQPTPGAPTQGDAERLQAKYQEQLDALAKQGATKFHFVDYAPPSFAVFQKQIALQLTLRNVLHFDAEKTSIYKRAAQSFDLFLAPQLKDLLEQTPSDVEFDTYDFSVLNQLASGPQGSSEAVEFICPRKAVRQFADAEITNQQLIDESVVLVNGVRIALNLQLVE